MSKSDSKSDSKSSSKSSSKSESEQYLFYTILVARPEHYIPLFRMMWQSMALFGDLPRDRCDLLIIGNRRCLNMARKDGAGRPEGFRAIHALEVPEEEDLHDSLLRKLDIVDFEGISTYEEVLYIDCDILVNGKVLPLLKTASLSPELLHVARESEDFNHIFFGFASYTREEKAAFKRVGAGTFNNGTYIFKPTRTMLGHFRRIRKFAVKARELRKRFYDQSFYNDYFNRLAVAEGRSTASMDLLGDKIVIFPKKGQRYPAATFVHFAGLSGYEQKEGVMRAYFNKMVG